MTTLPQIAPVEPKLIPAMIKAERRWLGWWAGPIKLSGKFDKFPVHPETGRKINPIDPTNWLSFEDAMDAYRRDMAKGIGFVLSDQHPIVIDGIPLYVTAIDLDQCAGKLVEHKALWRELGRPYLEISPSGNGLRMLGLSSTPLKGGNAGNGRELYSSGRFMTITGNAGRGTLRDISSEVASVERRWFPPKTSASTGIDRQPPPHQPATDEQIARVSSMLSVVSSDTTYEIWRDVIWSLASTRWDCARRLAHDWSQKAEHRYDADALDKLIDTFDPGRGITIGTLGFHAQCNGWSGNPPAIPEQGQASLSLLLTADQLRQLPATPYVVRGVLPAAGLAAIYGEPGSGKSFLALHLAHAIATGTPDWFGFPIVQAPVVYVALEGQGGLGRRITALELHSCQLCPDQLRFWCRDIHLLTGDGIDVLATEIVAAVGKGAVVIVDTLNQASPGADENSSQDMGKIIANAKHLAATTGGLALLVHHAGKDRSRGLRGHSSLLAAMDAVIEVVKEPAGRSWCIRKAKDDTGDEARDFELTPYQVGEDAHGPISSCAVQQAVHAKTFRLREPNGKNQKAALAELRRRLPVPGQPTALEAAISHVATVLSVAKPKERAKEAVDALIRSGHLSFCEGGICLV